MLPCTSDDPCSRVIMRVWPLPMPRYTTPVALILATLILATLTLATPACVPGRAPGSTATDSGPVVVDAGEDGGPEGGSLDSGPDAGCNLLDPSCPCPTGFHRCGDNCKFDTDPDYCGDSCTACPSPATNGMSTCSGTPPVCGIQCNTGTHLCGMTCALDDDPMNCGTSCTVCPTMPNAVASCTSGVCGMACSGSAIECAGGACGYNVGQMCGGDEDCCDGHCGVNHQCCTVAGAFCNQVSDCNSNQCVSTQFFTCQNNVCCFGPGVACAHDSDCCPISFPDGGMGGVCSNTFCKGA